MAMDDCIEDEAETMLSTVQWAIVRNISELNQIIAKELDEILKEYCRDSKIWKSWNFKLFNIPSLWSLRNFSVYLQIEFLMFWIST